MSMRIFLNKCAEKSADKCGTGKRQSCAGRGFTLIELVIVMAMIGLLLTLAVPRYFNVLDHGKEKVQQQNLASLRDAIDKFFGDQGRYPDMLDDLVQKRYLRSVPVDPITEKADWVAVAPNDPLLGGVYDVRSAAKADNDAAPAK